MTRFTCFNITSNKKSKINKSDSINNDNEINCNEKVENLKQNEQRNQKINNNIKKKNPKDMTPEEYQIFYDEFMDNLNKVILSF